MILCFLSKKLIYLFKILSRKYSKSSRLCFVSTLQFNRRLQSRQNTSQFALEQGFSIRFKQLRNEIKLGLMC